MNCAALKSVNLSSFTNVTAIGTHFLFACYGLRGGLDLGPLCGVVSIGPFFLLNTHPIKGGISNVEMMLGNLNEASRINVQFLEKLTHAKNN